jgi:hypothetical protein
VWSSQNKPGRLFHPNSIMVPHSRKAPFMQAFCGARHTTAKCRPFGKSTRCSAVRLTCRRVLKDMPSCPIGRDGNKPHNLFLSTWRLMGPLMHSQLVCRPLPGHHCCQPLCRITSVQLRGSFHSSEIVSVEDGGFGYRTVYR